MAKAKKKYKARVIVISFNLKGMRKRFNTLGAMETKERATEFVGNCVDALILKVQDKKEKKKVITLDDKYLVNL